AIVFVLKGKSKRLTSTMIVLSALLMNVSSFIGSCLFASINHNDGDSYGPYVITAILFASLAAGLIVAALLNYERASLAISIIYACVAGTLGTILFLEIFFEIILFLGLFIYLIILNIITNLWHVSALIVTSITLFASRTKKTFVPANGEIQGATVSPVIEQPEPTDPDLKLKSELAAAERLLGEGVITKEEYEAKRKKILGL
ncbi:MAG: SHOCT domain-containing protein, partial [Bacilli bacterium]|nr:SHOCT domain-containing protein [Bacilli bacterium]